MEDAWEVIKPYVDETTELRNEIKALHRMIDSCNEAFENLAKRYVEQNKKLHIQQLRLDHVYTKLGDVFGELELN